MKEKFDVLSENKPYNIQDYIIYDPYSGLFSWKILPNYNSKTGWFSGGKQTGGYSQLYFKGNTYLAHRVAWLCYYGQYPDNIIDHIDQNKRNNKISNLRVVTYSQNSLNISKPHKDSKSPYLGVSFNSEKKRWQTSIYCKGIKYWLGYFNTPKLAHEAYLNKKNELLQIQ